MIKKYALALLAFSSLNAERPTCENSPEPLTPEQVKYCENAQFFAALARNKPDYYDYFVKAAAKQLNACLNTAISPDQIQHMEAVIALELIPAHKTRHTLPNSAKRTAEQLALPLAKSVFKVIALTKVGKTITVVLDGQMLQILLPAELHPTLQTSSSAVNSISVTQLQETTWQYLKRIVQTTVGLYDPRNLSATQLVTIGVVIAAGAGYYVYVVRQDMQEPLPLVFFDTEEDVNRYMEEHGFSCDHKQAE